jgi:hypothetical protein
VFLRNCTRLPLHTHGMGCLHSSRSQPHVLVPARLALAMPEEWCP